MYVRADRPAFARPCVGVPVSINFAGDLEHRFVFQAEKTLTVWVQILLSGQLI